MEAFRLADTETTEIRTFGSFSEIVFLNRRPTDFCSLRPVTAIKAIHYFTGFTFRFQIRSSSHHPHKFIAVTEDGRSTDHTGSLPVPLSVSAMPASKTVPAQSTAQPRCR